MRDITIYRNKQVSESITVTVPDYIFDLVRNKTITVAALIAIWDNNPHLVSEEVESISNPDEVVYHDDDDNVVQLVMV